MADLPSLAERQRIAIEADPYYVRVDVPHDVGSPTTWVDENALHSAASCAVWAAFKIADRGVHTDVDPRNIQIRIWHADNAARRTTHLPRLVFDRTVAPPSLVHVLSSLADGIPDPPVPVDPAAELMRKSLGGPFDTDQALMVAMIGSLQQPASGSAGGM